MFDDMIDILKSAVVLLLLVVAAVALPFFIAACVLLFAGWVIYMIVKAIRLGREEERKRAEAKRKTEAADQTS